MLDVRQGHVWTAGHEVPLTARAETTPSPVGEAETRPHQIEMIMEDRKSQAVPIVCSVSPKRRTRWD